MAKKQAKKAVARAAAPVAPVKKVAQREHKFNVYSKEDMEELNRVVEKYRKRLEKVIGVEHVSGGYQYKNGVCTGKLAIRLEVTSEEHKKLLRRFLTELGVEKTYGEKVKFPVDIIVRNFRLAALPGDPIAAFESGTLGCIVTLGPPGSDRAFLTAAHVIATSKVLPAPLPPADVSVSDAGVVIGVVPGRNAGFFQCDAEVDCALIRPLVQPAPVPPIVADSGGLAIGMSVTMEGSRTRDSTGIIDSVDTPKTPPRLIDDGFGNVIGVKDQFFVIADNNNGGRAFALRGDSGAIVRLKDGTIAGILRATTAAGANSIAVVAKIDNAIGALAFQ